MLLVGYLLCKRHRNRTTDVEYSNLVDSMHAKRCYRICDSKIVSIYFLAAGRNKRLYVMPLRGRTGRMLHRNGLVEGYRHWPSMLVVRGASRPDRHFGSRTRHVPIGCNAWPIAIRFRNGDSNLI
jgi:hypothetical protein